MNNRGYTLIELMVVMVIMGIVISMAVQGYATLRETQELYHGAHQFATDLRLIQEYAMKERLKYQIRVTGNNTYVIEKYSGPASAAFDKVVASKTLVSPSLIFKNGSATVVGYTAEGTAANSGSIYVVKQKDLNRGYRVVVAAVLGRVRVESCQGCP